MNVFDPLSTYSSPSRRAVDAIEPNASEPEPGSVIAHAPILSIVTMSRAQRFFCAIVPFDMIAAEVSPTDTPIAVTMPGEHLQSSMIGSIVKPPPFPRSRSLPLAAPELSLASCAGFFRGDPLVEAVGGHLVHAERLVQLAQQVVRREVAVLELLAVRADLGVDERADRVPHHQQLFGPLEHLAPLVGKSDIVGGNRRDRPAERRSGNPPGRAGPDAVRANSQPGSHPPRSHFRRSRNGPKYLVPERWHGATDRSGGTEMDMRGATVSVVRGLPVDAALMGDVLVQLRRDALGCPLVWTLGNRGSADLDVDFFPVPTEVGRRGPTGLDHHGAPLGPRRPRGRARGRRGGRGVVRRVRSDAPARAPAHAVVVGPHPDARRARAGRRSTSWPKSCSGTRHVPASPEPTRPPRTAVHTTDVQPPRSRNTDPPRWVRTGVTVRWSHVPPSVVTTTRERWEGARTAPSHLVRATRLLGR